MDFETAYKRLEEINNFIKSEEIIDIDKLIALQEEAKTLYNFLQQKINHVISQQSK